MGTPLIDAAGLRGLESPLVFDCRFRLRDTDRGRRVFAEGHVPGARYLHLDEDLSGPLAPDGAGGRHPLPSPGAFGATMRAQGLTAGRPVVAYDDLGSPFAARLWWTLGWLGHAEAYVLDGGLAAWDGPLEAGEAGPVAPGDWTPRPDASWIATAEEVASGALPLIDCRAPARFLGEEEPLDPVAGHVPGAVNRFWRDLLDDGQRIVRAPSVPEGAALYCGSGVTACVGLLALAAHGGPRARLYPESWSGWLARGGAVG